MRVFCFVLIFITLGANTQMRRATTSEITTATQAVLATPQGSDIAKREVQPSQAMVQNVTTLLPLRLQKNGTSPFAQCAIAFVPHNKKPIILPTYGVGETEAVSCTSLKAIGALSSTEHPDIALIYEGYANNHSVTEAVVLHWNSNTYQVDDDAYRYLSTHLQKITIPAVRTALNTRKPE